MAVKTNMLYGRLGRAQHRRRVLSRQGMDARRKLDVRLVGQGQQAPLLAVYGGDIACASGWENVLPGSRSPGIIWAFTGRCSHTTSSGEAPATWEANRRDTLGQGQLCRGRGIRLLPAVARRLNIDFTIGVGYWGGKYYTYSPLDGHDVWGIHQEPPLVRADQGGNIFGLAARTGQQQ